MKKFISLLLSIMVLMSFGIIASAEKPDFNEAQWGDIFTEAKIAGSTEGVVLSGKGYESLAQSKYLIRHLPAYDVTNSSATIKFPTTFEGCDYNQFPDFTYTVGFCASTENWVNDVISVVFVIRPKSNSDVEISLAGFDGKAWTNVTTTTEPLMVKLGADRKLTLALKKTGTKTMTLANGEDFGTLTKTAQTAIDGFRKSKCFLKFGAYSEIDKDRKYEMKITITDLKGKLVVPTESATSSESATSTTTVNGTSSEMTASDTSATTINGTSSDKTTSETSQAVSSNSNTNVQSSSNSQNSQKSLLLIIQIIVIAISGTGVIISAILIRKKKQQ